MNSSQQSNHYNRNNNKLLPPIDEEDDDHLFQNIGLLTDNCVNSIITSRSESGDTNSSTTSLSSVGFNIQRSWTVKLQAARQYTSNNNSSGIGFNLPSTESATTSTISTVSSLLSSTSSPKTSSLGILLNNNQQSSLANSSLHSFSLFSTISAPILPSQPLITTTAKTTPTTTSLGFDLAINNNILLPSSSTTTSEENFHFVSVEHADTSFPVFLELWQLKRVCDITIVVGDRRFSAHRIILCATIPYFYAMFNNEWSTERDAAEVVLFNAETTQKSNEEHIIGAGSANIYTPSLDPEAFEALLKYAYTGSIIINGKNVQSILIGASYLGLVNVQQACADYLKVRLNVSNVLNLRSFAFALGCDTLVGASRKYIHRYFEEISRTDDFLALDHEELVAIIDSDELNIRGEEIVFEAIMAWTRKDEELRQDWLPDLLSRVRLPLLSPEYLVDVVMAEPLIRTSLPCRDLVDEAKDYHLLSTRRETMHRFRTRARFGHHVQGLIYAVGGLSKNGDSMSTVEVYDPTMKRWRMAEAMTMLRSRVGVAVMEGKLYAIGGYNGRERLNTVEVYDSRLKRWNKVNSMCYRRSAVGAAPLNGWLYVCGGYDGTTSLNAVERYSASHDLWDIMCAMNYHRSAAGVVAFDGYIYALGGHDGLMIFSSVERFIIRSLTFYQFNFLSF